VSKNDVDMTMEGKNNKKRSVSLKKSSLKNFKEQASTKCRQWKNKWLERHTIGGGFFKYLGWVASRPSGKPKKKKPRGEGLEETKDASDRSFQERSYHGDEVLGDGEVPEVTAGSTEVNGEYHEGGFETGEGNTLQSRNGETSLSIPAHEPGSRILPMNRDTRDSSQDTIKRSLPHRPATTASFPAKLDNDSDSEGIETPGGSGGGSMCKQGQVKRNSNATARASLGASSTTEMENAESDEGRDEDEYDLPPKVAGGPAMEPPFVGKDRKVSMRLVIPD